MAIKSVREISFFQNLRDRDISLCFCNFAPEKNSEEIVHLIHFLVSITKNELAENLNPQLEQLDKDCLISLSTKLEKHILNMKNNYTHVKGTVEAFKNQSCCSHALQISGKVTLSFVELVNLYHVLEYFETNYESFKTHIKNNNIPHQLVSFTLIPSSFYNSINSIKNNLQHRLGELIVNSYKLKNK
jgi:hypothetical protein